MKSKVAVIKTSPRTVVDDIANAMNLCDYRKFLSPSIDTILKINISWHRYYPACSTTPWQLEGVTKKLRSDGFKKIIPAQNRTVVVNPKLGARLNHLEGVINKYKLKFIYLYEPQVEWIIYEPRGKMLVLDRVYPDGIQVPKLLIGKNALHLPTMKTHVFTVITGSMKNAFGGLLNDNRHWTHSVIDETLVDLLQIQKEIHPGIFTVTDGTIAGNGAGPRAMVPSVKNFILAGGDSVAVDAVAAKMMGFEPMNLKFINLATEKGLGQGDPREIDVVGYDIKDINFGFRMRNTFQSRGQKMIYHGYLKPFEKLLLRSSLVSWSYTASRFYHDIFWYNLIGRRRVKKIMNTQWGELFKEYGQQ